MKAAAAKEREKRANGEIMRFLDKTRKKLAKDLEFWEAKSETDQAELVAEVERIDEEHAKDVIQKNEYEERKAEAEAEKEARLAEERRQRRAHIQRCHFTTRWTPGLARCVCTRRLSLWSGPPSALPPWKCWASLPAASRQNGL